MAGNTAYNWALIYRQIRETIRDGVCKPTWVSLSGYVNVPKSTLATAMKREFGIAAKDLEGLPDSSWPSQLAQVEEEAFPPTYQDINPKKLIKLLDNGPLLLSELANHLDRGTDKIRLAIQAMMNDGLGISEEEGNVWMPEYHPAEPFPTIHDHKTKHLKWGSISDIHIGSKFAQISALLKYTQIAHDEGVREIFVSGDITAGQNMYRGQANELYAIGADDQVEATVNTLPQLPGLRWFLMGGNHDYSFRRNSGLNVVKMICDKRSDLIYVGFDQVEIPMLENKDGKVVASLVMWHPSGGVPYAISYRGQKIAAEITRKEMVDMIFEEKPGPVIRWIQWGHLHVSDFFPHGPMWVFGPGCFEGTNGYLKAKGLTPIVGGYCQV